MEHLSNDHKDHPNQHKNSHKLFNERGFCFEFDGKWIEIETTTGSEFSNGGKATIE